MLEELVHHRYELPGFSTLDRLGIQAREKIHDVHFASIADQLDTKVKALVDGLFKVKSGESSSTWNLLKRDWDNALQVEARQAGFNVTPSPSVTASGEEGVGITISSLRELSQRLVRISPEAYAAMRERVRSVSGRLARGEFFKTAMDGARKE